MYGRFVSIGLMVLMLIGLFIVRIQAARQEGLFLAVPRIDASVPIAMLETFNERLYITHIYDEIFITNESRVMLTYEIRKKASITALRSRYDVIIIGTNHAYLFVRGLKLTSGSFFCRNATNAAVLNERAAFDLFGSFNISGNTISINENVYTVLGVINDRDNESRNIYIPAARLADNIGVIAANLGGLELGDVLSEWRQLGIDDDRYYFIDLNSLGIAVKNMFYIAIALAAMGILIFGVKHMNISKKLHIIKQYWKSMYMRDILKHIVFWQLLGFFIIVFAMLIACIVIFIQIFDNILFTIDIWEFNITANAFTEQIAVINLLMNLSLGMFIGFIVCFWIFCRLS